MFLNLFSEIISFICQVILWDNLRQAGCICYRCLFSTLNNSHLIFFKLGQLLFGHIISAKLENQLNCTGTLELIMMSDSAKKEIKQFSLSFHQIILTAIFCDGLALLLSTVVCLSICLSVRPSVLAACVSTYCVYFTVCRYFRHSVDSICSDDPDIVDLSASNTSATFPSFLHSYVYLMTPGDEVDELWKQHVSKVVSESSVNNTVYTAQLFPKLYRVS